VTLVRPLVSTVFAASLWLSAQPVDLPGWIKSIEAVDRSVLGPSARPPTALGPELRARVSKMSEPARVLAAQVLAKMDSPDSASVLLILVKDPSPSVASAASRALRDASNLPPGTGILQVIASVPSAPMRAHLFLAAGKAKTSLLALRQAMAAENDPLAKQAALAAAVRLGGDAERQALTALVRNARAEDVITLMDLLVYTGDKRMGAALLPLFDSQEPVMRISPDPESRMARKSDMAVWTAHELGLLPSLRLTGIRRFDPATIATARAACAKLK
jgi:hypothetical protein